MKTTEIVDSSQTCCKIRRLIARPPTLCHFLSTVRSHKTARSSCFLQRALFPTFRLQRLCVALSLRVCGRGNPSRLLFLRSSPPTEFGCKQGPGHLICVWLGQAQCSSSRKARRGCGIQSIRGFHCLHCGTDLASRLQSFFCFG